jgi:hypothetical protein
VGRKGGGAMTGSITAKTIAPDSDKEAEAVRLKIENEKLREICDGYLKYLIDRKYNARAFRVSEAIKEATGNE